jgi:translation initiation factor IF-3
MRKSFRGHNQKPAGPKEFRVNEKITSPELMVIDENGVSLGAISKEEALREARSRELDLVEVSPKANPPIAKFIDYGSFKYQKEKQERKHKAKQKTVETKTVKLSPRIGQHDLEIRAGKAVEFLQDGDKVKIELQLRGRENQHADLAKSNIRELVEQIKKGLAKEGSTETVKTEGDITRQGGKLSLNISL